MNKEVKQKWVAALNSGEYQQGKDVLKTKDNKFCCLGVLCDLHAKEFNKQWEEGGSVIRHFDYLGNGYLLPEEVVKWAELEYKSPYVLENNRHTTLSGLNDLGMPFASIAKLIDDSL